jgi:hypothetical protein
MKLIELQGALTAPCGYKWYSNGKSRFNKNYKHYLIKEDKIMTREEKLWTMRMVDLKNLADKLGIKINTKAAKEKAIVKILEAEGKTEEPKVNPVTEIKTEVEEPKAEEVKKVEEPKIEEVKTEEPKSEGNNLIPKKGAMIEYNGKSQNLRHWAREIGVSTSTLYRRIYKANWPLEKALQKGNDK